MLPIAIENFIIGRKPFLWINPNLAPTPDKNDDAEFSIVDIHEAQDRLERFAPLLLRLFPELALTRGIIESGLLPANAIRSVFMPGESLSGQWLIKADHTLPVAGSIKARGGIYEVLCYAERIAIADKLICSGDGLAIMSSPEFRRHFSEYHISTGSTGNLGLSIGIMAAALGFQSTVHMSTDAKHWKKERLRKRGVRVVEHAGDFGVAVAAGRAEANQQTKSYFVDDEQSRYLFLGYSVAALRLKQQLHDLGVVVDEDHPLFVYMPCGVGGAAGGVTFGLKLLFGADVHCFFAEPVASPAMLVRLSNSRNEPVSVREWGLDNRTDADGLAVGQASNLVAQIIRSMVSGIFTVSDDDLFEDLYALETLEAHRVEPSAAAAVRGPSWLIKSDAGRDYLNFHTLDTRMPNSTHVIWTTGGAFVPEQEYHQFYQRGRDIARENSAG